MKELIWKTGFLKIIAKFLKSNKKKDIGQGPRAKDLEPLPNFLPCWKAGVPLLWPTEGMASMLPMLGLSIRLHPPHSPGNQEQTKVGNGKQK